jgi:hypothetical protein
MADIMRKIKKAGIIISILLIIGFLAFSLNFFQQPAEAAPDASIYFEPASVSSSVGSSFDLVANINPGTNEVSSVELNITFDPAVLKLNSVTANAVAFPVVFAGPTIDNSAGTANLSLGIMPGATPTYIKATTAIATFNFTVLVASPGSQVSFAATSMAMAKGQGSTNVVANYTRSVVTALGRNYGNADFAILAADWLQTKSSPADVNSDGIVNAQDLGIMMSNWQ